MASTPYSVTGTNTLGGGAPLNLGTTATTPVAFHGATPTSQASFVATNSIGAISVSGVIGFSSSGALSNTLALLNAIQALLVAKGLMASS